ncbi:MAG: hypothetical protein Q7R63_01270 [bacterium]|nr:hypothetical protein [bacterium]
MFFGLLERATLLDLPRWQYNLREAWGHEWISAFGIFTGHGSGTIHLHERPWTYRNWLGREVCGGTAWAIVIGIGGKWQAWTNKPEIFQQEIVDWPEDVQVITEDDMWLLRRFHELFRMMRERGVLRELKESLARQLYGKG